MLRSDVRPARALATALLLGLGASAAPAATITVTSSADTAADDGVCTLREAIIAADFDAASGASAGECAAGSGADTIAFAIPGPGPHRIEPASGLPAVSQPLRIDADTQPGSDCAAGEFGIALQPGPASVAWGLWLEAPDSAIHGLSIGHFNDWGIMIAAAAVRSRVTCSQIGSTPDGLGFAPTHIGIMVRADDVRIGGTAAGERNLIAGIASGVLCENAARLTVLGNWFGLDRSGEALLQEYAPEFPAGLIANDCTDTEVGDGTAAGRNVFVAPGLSLGIGAERQFGAESSVRVRGNWFGLSASGARFLPLDWGLAVIEGDARVGGSVPGEGNVFAGAVGVLGWTDTVGETNRVEIEGNRFGSAPDGRPTTGALAAVVLTRTEGHIGGTGAGAGNLIANQLDAGIILDRGSTVSVLGNRIENNALGLRLTVNAPAAAPLATSANCITGNARGMVNNSGVEAIANGNWWGRPDGPSGEGPGHGDSIGPDILVQDFLTSAPAGCAVLAAPAPAALPPVRPIPVASPFSLALLAALFGLVAWLRTRS